jgi:hypothetical protein
MIDELAIRAALEAPMGASFAGLPVTRVHETIDPSGPHIRLAFVRSGRRELYRGIRRAEGMLDILVHVPAGDGDAAAEAIAAQIPRLFRASETSNATLTASDGTRITIREISIMSAYRGVDEAKSDQPWIIAPVQVDWRVDITAK